MKKGSETFLFELLVQNREIISLLKEIKEEVKQPKTDLSDELVEQLIKRAQTVDVRSFLHEFEKTFSQPIFFQEHCKCNEL